MCRFEILKMGLLMFCMFAFGYVSINNIRTTNSMIQPVVNQNRNVVGNVLREFVKPFSKDGNFMNGNTSISLEDRLRSFDCTRSKEYLSEAKPLVALASFPGSGNTWIRMLIEIITGVHSGSIYADYNFVGSKMCPARGRVFMVKTHRRSNKTHHPDCLKMGVAYLNYSRAVLVLRNPYYALLSEFNRQNVPQSTRQKFFNTENNTAPFSLFSSKKWRYFVNEGIDVWKMMVRFWTETFNRPTHVLVYEKMKENRILEVNKLMKFLNITVPDHSLYHCLSINVTEQYHRVKPDWMKIEKLYDMNLRKLVNRRIKNLRVTVGQKTNISDILHSYLLPID